MSFISNKYIVTHAYPIYPNKIIIFLREVLLKILTSSSGDTHAGDDAKRELPPPPCAPQVCAL